MGKGRRIRGLGDTKTFERYRVEILAILFNDPTHALIIRILFSVVSTK